MFLTDGAQVRMHLKGGPESERMIAVSLLAVQMINGTQPRELPVEAEGKVGEAGGVGWKGVGFGGFAGGRCGGGAVGGG